MPEHTKATQSAPSSKRAIPAGRSAGFTLIELSIVIAVSAVILGAVLSLVTAQIQNARMMTMRAKWRTIESALIMFVSHHNRLPCPAIETRSNNDADVGLETEPGTCDGTTALLGDTVRGMLPFRALGLSIDDVTDVYGGRFTYAVTKTATNLSVENITSMVGSMTLHKVRPKEGVVLGLPAPNGTGGGNQLNACGIDGADNSCNRRAVALILSHGPDGFGAFQQSGQQTPFPDAPSPREAENADIDTAFVSVEYSEQSGEEFDDELRAFSPDDILAPLIRDGAVPSAASITRERLRAALDAASALVLNNGGDIPGGLPASLMARDGWEQSIVYGTTITSVCNANAGAVAFTVQSLGPNRIVGPTEPSENDDIVLTALAGPLQFQVARITGEPCPSASTP